MHRAHLERGLRQVEGRKDVDLQQDVGGGGDGLRVVVGSLGRRLITPLMDLGKGAGEGGEGVFELKDYA